MTASSLEYKLTGIQRVSAFKETFDPLNQAESSSIDDFVNLFCEYQLADNNYMDIHLQASLNKGDKKWFDKLTLDEVLRFITYIIWTDKFVDGFLYTKISDHTLFYLLTRLEELQTAAFVPAKR